MSLFFDLFSPPKFLIFFQFFDKRFDKVMINESVYSASVNFVILFATIERVSMVVSCEEIQQPSAVDTEKCFINHPTILGLGWAGPSSSSSGPVENISDYLQNLQIIVKIFNFHNKHCGKFKYHWLLGNYIWLLGK